MIIVLRLTLLVLLAMGSSLLSAASVRVQNWWHEDPNLMYYYINVPTTDSNLKTFYDLVLYHGWKVDITGMNASSNILARLVKDPDKDTSKESQQDHPFPQNKQWYNDILFQSNEHMSFKITGDMSEQIKFTNQMIKSGFKEGFMKSDTPAFTQIITFYR